MKIIRYSKLFLIASYLCLFPLVNSSFAATWAIVKSDKAKIYSDLQMSSVIGYIKRGKKIRIGEVPKNKGRLLPIVVSKRIAYIEVKNIQYGEKVDTTKSVLQKYKDKDFLLKPVKRISFYSGTYIGTIDNQGFEEVLPEDLIFFTAGLRGYYDQESTNRSYRVSLGGSIAQDEDATIQFIDLAIAFGLGGLKSSYVDFFFYGGPVIAPYVEYEQGDEFKITGQALGAEFGAEVRFFLSRSLSFHIGGNYQFLKFFSMELPDNNFYPDEFDSAINGVKLLGTLSYSY